MFLQSFKSGGLSGWSESLEESSSQSDPLRSHTSAFVSREERAAGD